MRIECWTQPLSLSGFAEEGLSQERGERAVAEKEGQERAEFRGLVGDCDEELVWERGARPRVVLRNGIV
jgi:hypothetical protein